LFSRPGSVHGRPGFTILELMIVVAIIGLLVVLAIPNFVKQRMRTQDTAFLNDLRVLSAAFEQYAIERGDYPPDTGPGSEPAGFSEYMPSHIHWGEEPRIGGNWEWDRAKDRASKIFGVYAGLSVVAPQRTSSQMADIDAEMDDGDLDTGRFRRRDGGYICVFTE